LDDRLPGLLCQWRSKLSEGTAPRQKDALRRATILIVLVAMAGLVFAARVVPSWDDVIQPDGRIHLYGVDPYYHLRHATSAAKHFPTLLRFDAATQFPRGQRATPTGLFDLSIAAVSLLIAGGFDESAVARVAAWTPPILCVLIFVFLWSWARRSLGVGPGVFACAIFLIYPGSLLQRSLLGFADHHVAEVTLAAAMAGGLSWALGRAERDEGRLIDALPAALATVALVFTWVGSPLVWLVVAIALFAVQLLAAAQGRDPRRLARFAAVYGGWVIGLAALIGWLEPNLVMEPKFFARFMFSGLVFVPGQWLSGEALIWLRRKTKSPIYAALVMFAMAGFFLAGAFAHDTIREMADRLFGWDRAAVAEHMPVTWKLLRHLFGGAALLALAGFGLAIACLRRRALPASQSIGVALCGLWLGLWWAARDFDYLASLYIPWMAAYAVAAANQLDLTPRSPLGRRTLAALLVALVVAPIWPLSLARTPWPKADERRALMHIHDGWDEAMTWLRENTPPEPFDLLDPVPGWSEGDLHYPEGAYGVLSGWEFGNIVALNGRRFVRHSRFPTRWLSSWWTATDEDEAFGHLLPEDLGDDRPLRYVVVDAIQAGEAFTFDVEHSGGRISHEFFQVSGPDPNGGKIARRVTFGRHFENSMAARLALHDGQGLGRLRLVYESSHTSYQSYIQNASALGRRTVRLDSPQTRRIALERLPGPVLVNVSGGYDHGPIVVSSVKIYQIVEGALLRGRATPGSVVVAALELQSKATGRRWIYRTSVPADASGAFALRVPYPTEYEVEDTANVKAISGYSIASFSGANSDHEIIFAGLAVPRKAVIQGMRIDF
jgi:asparagine N-glycosylation enzyme membrane subunit Stt3